MPREHFDNQRTDRENLALPEYWIEALDAPVDVQLMLDILWQSFDLERCYHCDAAGVCRDQL